MAAPKAAPAGASPKISATDRVLIIGQTGSGKSVLGRALFRKCQMRKILIDPKNDRDNAMVDVHAIRDPSKLDWKAPVQRYIPRDPTDQDELEAVYVQIFAQRDLLVLLQEVIVVAPPNGAAKHLKLVQTQGRSRGIQHIAESQRPVMFEPLLRSQADHLILFNRSLPTRDLTDISREMGFDRPMDLQREVIRNQRTKGDRGYLHFERSTGRIYSYPPLPEWIVKNQQREFTAAQLEQGEAA